MVLLPELRTPPTAEQLEVLTAGAPEFAHLIIKEYQSWRLYLNADQRYFGRSYVWLTSRHVDMHQLTDLTRAEAQELFSIMRAFGKIACSRLLAATVNACWLGNEVRTHRGHGHMHLIPRYIGKLEFNKRRFIDERFGRNYAPYEKLILPHDELLDIKGWIQQLLDEE